MDNRKAMHEMIRQLKMKINHLEKVTWTHYEFLTWHWFLLLVFFVVPWIAWYILYDKKRGLELFLVGSLCIIPTTLLDSIGSDLMFWDYPNELIPFTPRAMPFDMTMVPVGLMFIYQYLSGWKTYLIGVLILALTYAFIGEPFTIWINLVAYYKWHVIYSFFYYIVLGVSVKVFIQWLKGRENNNNE